jgi:xanthine dehydrogenase accessory factor
VTSVPDTVTTRSAELRAARVPFVHARVVLAERPTSAKPGDEALVLADGTIEGFVGGTCAEATVRERSLASLASGETVLLRITPQPEDDVPGKQVVHNACLSGGTLEIFLEPAVPAPLVGVVGDAPIARSLLALGEHLGYELRPIGTEVPEDAAAVVIASHGRDEEQVLQAALRAGVPYVGLVASPRRGAAVLDSLGLDPADRDRISTPAGFDIGARTPAEVAISILAEIIASRPRAGGVAGGPADPPVPSTIPSGIRELPQVEPTTAIDPVCGMSVAAVDSSLHVDHGGTRVYFCGSGCVKAFTADPAAYGA